MPRARPCEKFQAETNFVAPQQGADTEANALNAVSGQLISSKAALTALQTRLASDDTNLPPIHPIPTFSWLTLLRKD